MNTFRTSDHHFADYTCFAKKKFLIFWNQQLYIFSLNAQISKPFFFYTLAFNLNISKGGIKEQSSDVDRFS